MFIRRVNSHIPWPLYRVQVRKELYDHIYSHAEYLQKERGFSEEDAVTQAMLCLGDPDETGREINRAHCSPQRMCRIFVTFLIWIGIISCALWLALNLCNL